MFSRRRFLKSLSRSALVLPLADVLASAAPSVPTGSDVPKLADLGVHFENIAHAAGLTEKTIYGGEHKNKYLLETTGCGIAFYDYDHDGWLDIFIVNGWRLEGFPAGQEPHSHLFKNNRDGTFTDISDRIKPEKPGHGMGVVFVDVNGDGRPDIYVANDTYDNYLFMNRGKVGEINLEERGQRANVARCGNMACERCREPGAGEKALDLELVDCPVIERAARQCSCACDRPLHGGELLLRQRLWNFKAHPRSVD